MMGGKMLKWGLAQARGPSPGLGVLRDWPLNHGQEFARQRRMWEQGEQRVQVQRSLQTAEALGGTLGRDETGEADCALRQGPQTFPKSDGVPSRGFKQRYEIIRFVYKIPSQQRRAWDKTGEARQARRLFWSSRRGRRGGIGGRMGRTW